MINKDFNKYLEILEVSKNRIVASTELSKKFVSEVIDRDIDSDRRKDLTAVFSDYISDNVDRTINYTEYVAEAINHKVDYDWAYVDYYDYPSYFGTMKDTVISKRKSKINKLNDKFSKL